jgi:hypothetical protein
MKLKLTATAFIAIFAIGLFGSVSPSNAQTAAATTTETIVLIRHGEKPAGGLGQLTVKGLNRALALPAILIGKFGIPAYIFAPDPAEKADNGQYSYVRPLATIEPTAIELGMPVNAQIGYEHIADLQAELTKPQYASSTIFVAWEHGYLDMFAQNMVKTYGGAPSIVPPWPDDDYDTIFVITLTRSGATTTETFKIDHEGLNGKLSNKTPKPG